MLARAWKWLVGFVSPSRCDAASGLKSATRDRWLDVIERHGYTAHFWLPGIAHHADRELWEALEGLKNAGFIVIDANGALAGKVAKARLPVGELAEQRRAQFRIVE
ncbi:MAG: hypothetical protein CVV05_01430 [Gammaproteobacteria bacterium HGW-Gammaproteobacteria-1]|jgi:hypothetical protein|nr:MAG: hypothetical protein CVV05_01430 [Gammaproteobacteria bacterium HGW-Gammaproteobacteria-1]